ncbi:unnamed protein product [Moneuplotes crassus]|uniref:START domain-containing protein n=1 Tax=Euplotes crassus TaxID=5936 RepID=A0AAD1XJU8_EUPCR|nr:unnamed protein product [Moneuplotes crassus]
MESSQSLTPFTSDAATLLPSEPSLDDAGSQEALDLMLQAREKFAEGIALFSDEDWDLKKDKDNVKLWTKKSEEGGANLFRREASLDQSAEAVSAWLSDQQNLVDNNDKLKSSEIICELNEQALLIRREMKGNMIVSNRDLALFWNKVDLTDGSIAHVMFSIEHDSIPKTKCVRAEADINLLILQPVSDTSCVLLNIGKMDPKGSIPTSFVNKMVTKQYDDLVKIKKLVEA